MRYDTMPDDSAFVQIFEQDGKEKYNQSGLTKREWMATRFMASRLKLIAAEDWLTKDNADKVAEEAVIAVDALIEALNKPTNDKP